MTEVISMAGEKKLIQLKSYKKTQRYQLGKFKQFVQIWVHCSWSPHDKSEHRTKQHPDGDDGDDEPEHHRVAVAAVLLDGVMALLTASGALLAGQRGHHRLGVTHGQRLRRPLGRRHHQRPRPHHWWQQHHHVLVVGWRPPRQSGHMWHHHLKIQIMRIKFNRQHIEKYNICNICSKK